MTALTVPRCQMRRKDCERWLGFACTIAGLLGPTARATELKPETAAAFDRYIRVTEERMDDELRAGRFFVIDSLPQTAKQQTYSQLRQGQFYVEPLRTKEDGKSIPVPGGLIHHWVGVAFIPGATLSNTCDSPAAMLGVFPALARPSLLATFLVLVTILVHFLHFLSPGLAVRSGGPASRRPGALRFAALAEAVPKAVAKAQDRFAQAPPLTEGRKRAQSGQRLKPFALAVPTTTLDSREPDRVCRPAR